MGLRSGSRGGGGGKDEAVAKLVKKLGKIKPPGKRSSKVRGDGLFLWHLYFHIFVHNTITIANRQPIVDSLRSSSAPPPSLFLLHSSSFTPPPSLLLLHALQTEPLKILFQRRDKVQHAVELSEKILSIKQGREVDGEKDRQGRASAVEKSLEALGKAEGSYPPGKMKEGLVKEDVREKLENVSKHEEEFAEVKSEIAGLKDKKRDVLGPKEKELERIEEEVS